MLFIENISGFTQDESGNGILELHEKLLSSLDDYSQLSVRIRPRRWNENWRAIALNYHTLHRRYHSEPFVILVNAYSYGAGHGLTSLARQLNRYNLTIACANLCDGVYWHWHPMGWWRAMIGNFRIKIPTNVRSFHGFYQRKNNPCGKDLIYDPTATEKLSWNELFVEHQWMDDDIEWHDHCIKVARELAAKSITSIHHVPSNAPQSRATELRSACITDG